MPPSALARDSGRQEIDAGAVFDLTLPLDHAAEGYRAMDERRAIKTLLPLNPSGRDGRRKSCWRPVGSGASRSWSRW
jgi:hypothetical protein